MICKNCNNPIDDGARFCGFCGAKVEDEVPVMAAAEPTPAVTEPTPAAPVYTAEPAAAPAYTAEPAATPVYTADPTPAAPVYTAEPTPAAPVFTAEPTKAEPVFTAEPAAAAPAAAVAKKKIRIVPIIIAAAAAILVIAGVLIFFFGRSAIMRMFMGEPRYAISLVTDYADNLKSNDPLISMLADNGTKSADTAVNLFSSIVPRISQSGSSDPITTVLDGGKQLNSVVGGLSGAQGVGVDLSADVSLDKAITESLSEGTAEFFNAIMNVINSTEISASAKSGDSSQAAFSIKTNGSDLISANVYMDESGNAYVNIPGILDKPILIKSAITNDTDSSDESDEADDEDDENAAPAEDFKMDEKKLSEIYNKILKAWEESYKEAEFSYEDAEYSVGDSESEKTFKGTRVSVTLSQEDFCKLLIDIVGIIDDDTYCEEIAAAFGMDADDFHDALDDVTTYIEDVMDNDELSLKVTVDSYVTADNTPCGVEVSVSYKMYGEKRSMGFSCLSAGENTSVSATMNKIKQFELVSTKKDNSSGTLEAEVNISNTEKKPVGVKIAYENLGKQQLFGSDVLTGKFELSLNVKSMKDDLSGSTFWLQNTEYDWYSVLSKSKMTVESAKEGDGIRFSLGADINKMGKGTLNVTVRPVSEDVAAAPANAADAYDISEITGSENLEMQLSALNYMKNKAESSEDIAALLSAIGYSSDNISSQIESLEANKEFYRHYSAYDPYNSGRTAAEWAGSLCSDIFYGDNHLTDDEMEGKEFTVKLWFDKDGRLTVIDNGGFDCNWSNVFPTGRYKNMYAEACVKNGICIGITTVLTDDPSDLPSVLPNYFNFYDKLFMFDSSIYWDYSQSAGAKDGFVIGAYPSLDIGESTTEKKLNDNIARIDDFNAYAKKVYETLDKFMKSHGASVDPSIHTMYSIKVSESGEVYDDSYSDPLDVLFTKPLGEYKEQLYAALVPDGDLRSVTATVIFSDGKMLGVTVNDGDYYDNTINEMSFKLGGTQNWSFADGIVFNSYYGDSYVLGTYPVLPSLDNETVLNNALELFAGTWCMEYRSDLDIDKHIVSLTKEELASLVPDGSFVFFYQSEIYVYDKDGNSVFYYYVNYAGEKSLVHYDENGEYTSYTSNLEL